LKRRGGAGTVVVAALIVVVLAAVGFYFVGGYGNSLKGGFSDVSKGIGAIQSQGSEVQITTVSLISDTFDGSEQLAPTCGSSPSNSYISLSNSGTSDGGVSSVTITYGGAENLFKVDGSCTVGPSSSLYVLFPGPSALPNSTAPGASEPFLGTVNLSNGVKLPFSGSFQQGSPRVSLAAVTMIASQLAQGTLGATCSPSPPPGGSYLELTNSGTEGATPQQVDISWKEGSVTVPITGSCDLGPAGTQSANTFVVLSGIGQASQPPSQGESYSVDATLRNGAAAPIVVQSTGSFE